jgi:hypothetical protein
VALTLQPAAKGRRRRRREIVRSILRQDRADVECLKTALRKHAFSTPVTRRARKSVRSSFFFGQIQGS